MFPNDIEPFSLDVKAEGTVLPIPRGLTRKPSWKRSYSCCQVIVKPFPLDVKAEGTALIVEGGVIIVVLATGLI